MAIRYIPFLWRWQRQEPLDSSIEGHPQAWRLRKLRMTPEDLNRSMRAQLDQSGVGGLANELATTALPDRVDQKGTGPELPVPKLLEQLTGKKSCN